MVTAILKYLWIVSCLPRNGGVIECAFIGTHNCNCSILSNLQNSNKCKRALKVPAGVYRDRFRGRVPGGRMKGKIRLLV